LSYIGNTPADKYQTLEKQSFTTSATTGYTLSYSVSSPQDIALFINNVRQNPNSSYTVLGTTLTLTSATTGTDVMYAVFLGKSVGTIAPAVGSVTNDMLSGSIATSKLADGSTFGQTNTPSFSARMSGAQTISNETYTKVDFDTEDFDTDGAYDHSTNQRFTVPSDKAGKYFFNCFLLADSASSAQLQNCQLAFYKNGSVFKKQDWSFNSNDILYAGLTLSSLMNLAVSDYIEVFVRISDASGSPIIDVTDATLSEFSGFKLI